MMPMRRPVPKPCDAGAAVGVGLAVATTGVATGCFTTGVGDDTGVGDGDGTGDGVGTGEGEGEAVTEPLTGVAGSAVTPPLGSSEPLRAGVGAAGEAVA
jgi:hypothetical protein